MRWQFFLCLTIICLGFIRSKSIPDFRKNQWKKFKVDLHTNHGPEAEEIHRSRRIFKRDQRSLYSSVKDESVYLELPKGRDWRSMNVVTKVKDQGTCDEGDWAFAAIGALEGLLARIYHNLTELSEQQLIDCTKTRGNYGCEGGAVKKAFDYIYEHGVWTEKSYPYTGMDDVTVCANKSGEKLAKGLKINLDIITTGDESQMKQKLYHYGPILAIIDASQESFLKYPGGIYHDDKCAKHGKHNVLIVGYGETEQKEKYWIVKNSWGEEWGEQGYIRIARDNNNTCGIATNATFINANNEET